MNQTYYDLFQTYLKADKDQVASVGKDCFNNIMERFYKLSGDKDLSVSVALSSVSMFMKQDKHFDDSEWALISYIVEERLSREEAFTLVNDSSNYRIYEIIKDICTRDNELKQNIIKLGLCISAIDGNISEDEAGLVQWLLN